jgi:hypothetical protein
VANGTTTPVITLQVPTASASNRGALSSTDWTTFNNKGSGSVTSVGFTGGIITVATPTTTPAFTIAGTSGGIPYFSTASTWASSAALAAGSLVLGGGAGVTPATTATGTGVVTALGVNTGTAGAFVVNGGALGTPSSGTVTNLTGTASININGTVGATTPATGSFTTLQANASVNGSSGVLTTNANAGAGAAAAFLANNGTNQSQFGTFGTGYSAAGALTANSAYIYNSSGAGVAIVADSGGTVRIGAGGTTTVATFTSAGINGVLGGTTPAAASVTTLKASTGAAVGNATPGAGGIAFPATAVAVADPNTLDDYEEGTWTPVLNSFTQVGVATANGTYTKIGNVVHIYCQIIAGTTIASIAGTSNITGLPFTVGKSGGCVISNFSTAITDGTGTIYEAGPIYPCSWAATGQAHTIQGTYFV